MATYREAGVDIDAGEETVSRIAPIVRQTFNEHVLTDIGAFGAFYQIPEGYRAPVLVSSVDGVGTKLKVAFLTGRHASVGEDLVNHCVNDIAVCGAKPLYFLDYLATGKLEPAVAEQIISGFAKACKENGCALIGGETAEMPGFYSAGEYDLAGMIVGIVEREHILDGKRIKEGDRLIGIPSMGLHTNGYSLARKVLLDRFKPGSRPESLNGLTLGDALMSVHRSYLHLIQALTEENLTSGLVHVTGGGIPGNTQRVIPKGLSFSVDYASWERPALFRLIQAAGEVPEEDMRRTFNLGIGLVAVVSENKLDAALDLLQSLGEKPVVIGQVHR